jgi:hypothetical protein
MTVVRFGDRQNRADPLIRQWLDTGEDFPRPHSDILLAACTQTTDLLQRTQRIPSTV